MNRFHREAGGLWVESEEDARSFREEQVVDIYAQQEDGDVWMVVIELEDGRRICPDFELHGTKESAEAGAAHWDEMLGHPCRYNRKGGTTTMSESKSDKPRICEVLGVEVGEEWHTTESKLAYRVSEDGSVEVKFCDGEWHKSSDFSGPLLQILNGTEKIIQNPIWTQEDVEDAKALRRIYPLIHYVEREEELDTISGLHRILFKARPDGSGETLRYAAVRMFPSLKPGASASLDDILETETFNTGSADAEKHGEWLGPRFVPTDTAHCYCCSICGAEAQHREYDGVKMYYKFCPNCGAEMG